ncbi:MAG: hypothetical protein ACSW8D_01055 [Prevotella sp.]
MILNKDKGMRMWGGGFGKGSSGSGGSGGSGGGGGSVAYADEAGHAASADEATHATSADTATNAGHATTADEATHATSADTATNAGHADSADEATHATNADNATHATSAADLDQNSTVWSKVLRKDVADTAAEIITFAKGLVSTLVSKFKAGIKIGANDDYGIDANGDATLRDISGRNTTTESLTVTKEAHFFKLVVDELAANKGAIIVSSANCVAEIVVAGNGYYDVYFSTTDKNGNAVVNPWMVNDQAICMTFTGAAGTFTNVSNRYYWRLVTQVASNETYQGATYHRIRLSSASGQYDGSTAPAAGDEIVQLGYRGSVSGTDYRKSAVILSAYPTPDTDLTPASLAFYQGIVTFSLSTYRKTYLDALNNEFIGNFKVLINGSAKNVATLLVTMDGLISNVQKKVGHNLLSTEAWTDGNGTLIEDFDSATTQYDAYQEGSSAFTAFSPLIYLDPGTYCFSWYGSGPSAFYYGSSTPPTKPYDVPSSGVVGLTSQAVSGDSYKQKIRQYATFTLTQGKFIYLHLFRSSSFSFCRPMLQKVDELTDTPTAWDAGQQLFGSIIQQAADLIRLQVGQCGLDLTNEAITAKGGKFKMQDNAGNDTFVLDQNGNLVSQGDASFGGTIKAQNFYHGVVMHGKEDCWLCLSQDSGSPYSFTPGKYYTQAEVAEISNNQYGSPPTYIDTSRGFYEAFVNCTGSADIVVIMAGTSGTGDLTIVLPCAADYDGKIVEIVDTRYVQSGYMGSLYASQADGGWKMKGNFNQSTPSNTVTLNGNYDTEGRSRRLLSYKQDYNGVMTSFWIVLKTS